MKVKEAYGLTEAGGPLRDPASEAARAARKLRRPNARLRGEAGRLDGTKGVSEGELWTRNPCVTAGYHNLPEVTREKIVDGWLADRRHLPCRRRRILLLHGPRGRHVQLRRARTSIRRKSKTCCSRIRPCATFAWCRCRMMSRASFRPPLWCCTAEARDSGRAQDLLPGAWAGFCASAPHHHRRRIAAVRRRQTRPQSDPAAADRGRAAIGRSGLKAPARPCRRISGPPSGLPPRAPRAAADDG